ncbi:MAG: hypothetical protein Q9182_007627 [Xanthomendoza sp. 2 TL-2023]
MPGRLRRLFMRLLCGACAASKEEPEAPARPVVKRPPVDEGKPETVRVVVSPKPGARQTSSVYSRPTASSSGSWREIPAPSPVPSVSSEISVWTLARVRERIAELESLNSPVPHRLRKISEASGDHRALSPDMQWFLDGLLSESRCLWAPSPSNPQ